MYKSKYISLYEIKYMMYIHVFHIKKKINKNVHMNTTKKY